MDLQLKGKKAILAGATKGIGRAVAEVLAAEGCAIELCARDKAGVEEAVQQLRERGGSATGESVDLGNADAYRDWVTRASERLGGCDIFVCFGSAGGGAPSEERWQAAFELDLLATYRGIDAALPTLEKSGSASIVVISTTVAIEPAFGPQPYAALKAAVTNYAGALAHSLAPKGIRVNTVSPGPILIEGGAWDKIKAGRPEFYEKTVNQVPLGRLGQAAEVANAVAFLASPVSAFTTGTNLVIDGGMTKRVQH
ncbi:MAG TPA: SDR family NAD(P)-dependent oxidoreductase [Noviherbaspirillum sp.]|uniref:SDR family NAD(P)-dependent oxidoreductase n=1 Tax=Noviherbaspirillum sp. TaxID=1926288 RepID=UPI002B491B03|nr:SDR family NAD(P)-dependent oxidoreductase [Noviherbaspirillum sp.]HJV86592.1 SDR family NAD(P)-dependent oxidoreductase [Noviherbaspirillum sp.]